MTISMTFNKYWNSDKDEYSDRNPDRLVGWGEGYPYIADQGKILDIGCGIGNVVAWLNNKGHDAYGITYQKEEVARAHSLDRVTISEYDMHNISIYGDDSFDAFIMWDSLEHSIAPLIALGEAKRVIKPEGKGLIFIPNQDWVECHYHIIVPTIRQMKHLIGLAGLEIVEIIDMGNEQAIYKLLKGGE